MIGQNLWSDSAEKELVADLEQLVSAVAQRQESKSPLPISELFFDDVYSEMPWFLKEQQAELLQDDQSREPNTKLGDSR